MPREARSWVKDGYLVSSDQSLLQLEAINEALASDLMWWTQRLPDDTLKTMVESSLCLGLYKLHDPSTTGAGDHTSPPKMIGLSRLITDFTTFGYLTDVYVLEGYQGKGFARWMMECLNEILEGWPDLRRMMLLTHNEPAARLYRTTLGALEWSESPSAGLMVMEKRGKGVKNFAESGS